MDDSHINLNIIDKENKENENKEDTDEEAYLDLVSEMTLEYLMNKTQYAKYCQRKEPNKLENNKKDKKFYRKRIHDLTKQLMNNETPDFLLPDVLFSFELYVRSCVQHFKILDKADILQEEYSNINLGNGEFEFKNNVNPESVKEANELIMRPTKILKVPTLYDNFIKKAKVTKKEFLPLKKNINLKDPILKTKGIKEKEKDTVTDTKEKKKKKRDE